MTRQPKKIDRETVLSQTLINNRRIERRINRVYDMEQDKDQVARCRDSKCKICHYQTRIAGQGFCDRACGLCNKMIRHGSTDVPVLCEECAKKHSLCRQCGSDLELRTRRQIFEFESVPDPRD